MTSYYAHIDHTNSSDDPESILSVESTEAEKKRIKALHIVAHTNEGKLKPFIEREGLVEGDGYIKTGAATLQNELVIPLDHELPIGQKFELTLQNVAAGTNAALVGWVEYEIVA